MGRLIGLAIGIGIVYGVSRFDLPFWAWLAVMVGILGVIAVLKKVTAGQE
jgi:hypothetical protein